MTHGDYTIRSDLKGVTADHLVGFFAGWPNPPHLDTHLKLLENSDFVVIAWHKDQVVGFCTAVSDHTLCAYIPLLEVVSEHQKKGVGKMVLRAMRDQLSHLYMIDLVCDPGLAGFYRDQGFQPLQAMGLRNYDRQSGNVK